MSNKTLSLDDNLYRYLLDNSLREAPILKKLREKTASMPASKMQIAPEQGQFMMWLLDLMGAKNTLEIGVYTGYSTLCTALALPSDGKIIACDVSEKYTSVAKTFWQEAGVADKINLILAPAKKTLETLVSQHQHSPLNLDFVFIDADKENYFSYYELALPLVRAGGVILIDNTLWGGAVADHSQQDDSTIAIRKFNQHLLQDTRIRLSLLPLGDGLTLARKV